MFVPYPTPNEESPFLHIHLALTALGCACFAAVASAQAQDAPRPNIIVILSDDMGYSDLGCYGGEIQTPALDRLAAGGLRYTQFYNTGRCCPTRASLLTGLYPHQAGVGHMMEDRGLEGYRGNLNQHCRTMAEVVKTAGYRTYMCGKWHVTRHTQPEGPKHNWPLQRGFDRFYGTITGAGSFYDPGTLTRDNTMISPFADPEYKPEQYYYTHALSDHAAKFINEHCEEHAEQPFFMYLAYTAAHWPMHALEKDIAKYQGKYDAGYEPIRATRHARLKELGLIDPAWDLSPQHGDWSQVEHKEWEARCMEVYAAMIDSMDQGIAQVVQTLEMRGQLDNTLILFMQDNGGCQEGNGRQAAQNQPASFPKIAADAIRLDVVPKQDRAGVPTKTGPQHMPGPADTYIAYGMSWANVSNTPFREYKHFVHEGGISTPLIAHWPKEIKRRGELETQPGHLIDIMATCVELSGAKYPKQVGDETIHPLEGVSLRPSFAGKPLARQQPIFWEHEGNRAVRDGDWKLVAKENRPWELYNLKQDRTEQHDLAEKHPERVRELAAKWDAYATRAHVLPLNAWRGKTGAQSEFSPKKVFELGADDSLSREQSPHVHGQAFRLEVTLAEVADSGVIVAQGGSSEGYVLYVKDGKLRFGLRHRGELTEAIANNALAKDAKQISVVVGKNGAVQVRVDDREVAAAKVKKPFLAMPLDGLDVGRDEQGAVGEYEAPYPYVGKIKSVRVSLE